MQAYVEEMGDTSLCKARASPLNYSPTTRVPTLYRPATPLCKPARGSLRGRTSAAPRPRLGRTSAAPRPRLGRASRKASDGAGCGDKEKDFIAKWSGGRVAERRPRGD